MIRIVIVGCGDCFGMKNEGDATHFSMLEKGYVDRLGWYL